MGIPSDCRLMEGTWGYLVIVDHIGVGMRF